MPLNPVDSKDLLILDALKRNAKASVARLAKETGLPGTTIHNRIDKLRSSGIIRGYTIKVDNKKLGNDIGAFLAVTVDYDSLKKSKIGQEELAEKIGELRFVEAVSIVTGDYDIIVKVRVKNIEELNKFIIRELRTYPGIEKSYTMIILSEVID